MHLASRHEPPSPRRGIASRQGPATPQRPRDRPAACRRRHRRRGRPARAELTRLATVPGAILTPSQVASVRTPTTSRAASPRHRRRQRDRRGDGRATARERREVAVFDREPVEGTSRSRATSRRRPTSTPRSHRSSATRPDRRPRQLGRRPRRVAAHGRRHRRGVAARVRDQRERHRSTCAGRCSRG